MLWHQRRWMAEAFPWSCFKCCWVDCSPSFRSPSLTRHRCHRHPRCRLTRRERWAPSRTDTFAPDLRMLALPSVESAGGCSSNVSCQTRVRTSELCACGLTGVSCSHRLNVANHCRRQCKRDSRLALTKLIVVGVADLCWVTS